MLTKGQSNGPTGLVLNAFCIIFQAGPVGNVLGAKFGQKPANIDRNLIKTLIQLIKTLLTSL